jgi:hypothetical protein
MSPQGCPECILKSIPESVKTGPSFKLSGIRENSEHKTNDIPPPSDRGPGTRPSPSLLPRDELIPAAWSTLNEGAAVLLNGGNLPQLTMPASRTREQSDSSVVAPVTTGGHVRHMKIACRPCGDLVRAGHYWYIAVLWVSVEVHINLVGPRSDARAWTVSTLDLAHALPGSHRRSERGTTWSWPTLRARFILNGYSSCGTRKRLGRMRRPQPRAGAGVCQSRPQTGRRGRGPRDRRGHSPRTSRTFGEQTGQFRSSASCMKTPRRPPPRRRRSAPHTNVRQPRSKASTAACGRRIFCHLTRPGHIHE